MKHTTRFYILTGSLALLLSGGWLFGVDVDGVSGAGTVTALPFFIVFALGTLGAAWFGKTKCFLPLLTLVGLVFLSTTGVATLLPSYTTREPFSAAWLLPVFASVAGILAGGSLVAIFRCVLLAIRKLFRYSKTST